MRDEIEDLTGRRSSRLSREERRNRAQASEVLTKSRRVRRNELTEEEDETDRVEDLPSIKSGVTVSWLAALYDMQRKTILSKLTGCPVMRRSRAGAPIYDLTVAAGYLSGHKKNVMAALKVAKEEDFPLPMQRNFWKTKILRDQWELDAGQLWKTQDVLSVFADTFTTIKNAMQLWVDNLEMQGGLSEDQRNFMIKQVDSLSDEIHERMIDLPRRKKTKSLKDVELPNIEKMMEIEDVDKDFED